MLEMSLEVEETGAGASSKDGVQQLPVRQLGALQDDGGFSGEPDECAVGERRLLAATHENDSLVPAKPLRQAQAVQTDHVLTTGAFRAFRWGDVVADGEVRQQLCDLLPQAYVADGDRDTARSRVRGGPRVRKD